MVNGVVSTACLILFFVVNMRYGYFVGIEPDNLE